MTVSMTVSHLYQNLKIVKGVRILKYASEGVDYCDKRAKSLCRRHLPPLSWLGGDTEAPSSLFKVGVFDLIHMLSLIHLLNLSLSCSTISLASQFIIWIWGYFSLFSGDEGQRKTVVRPAKAWTRDKDKPQRPGKELATLYFSACILC